MTDEQLEHFCNWFNWIAGKVALKEWESEQEDRLSVSILTMLKGEEAK
jgi:hypothetical protein